MGGKWTKYLKGNKKPFGKKFGKIHKKTGNKKLELKQKGLVNKCLVALLFFPSNKIKKL